MVLEEKSIKEKAKYVGVYYAKSSIARRTNYTIFQSLEWQIDLIIGLPILIFGALVAYQSKNE